MQQHEIKPPRPKKGMQGCRDAGQKCLVGGEHGPGEEDPRRDHLLCHLLENIAARELRLDCHDRLGQLLGPVDGAQCPRKSLCQDGGREAVRIQTQVDGALFQQNGRDVESAGEKAGGNKVGRRESGE
jgi:hypothetical protein